ncbi:hypothetical protein N9Z17_04295 [Planktomarina temperata]|nr:hypothetical protein [Planktomarina temperata]
MYKVELYIDGQRADLFQNENIEINLSVQNIKDISKVFGDFTQSFTIPASVQNNKIFKHYYNVDISGSFNASVRVDAFIEVNHNLFRAGVLELESVQVKQGQPYAYSVGFFSNVTSLKDKFGEDNLTDLDLSAYDHTYNDTNIEAGLDGYVSGTSNSIIYPLISPVANWIYDSTSSDSGANNIWYHNGHPEHGVFYYDLKPAIKLQKILDAIESKYSVTFNSDFFDSADFGKLFMWCHRRAGYMFKDQEVGATSELIELVSGGGTPFDDTLHRFPVTASANPALIAYTCTATASTEYRIDVYINDIRFSSTKHTGNVSNIYVVLPTLLVGDYVEMRLAPSGDGQAVTVGVTANWYADTGAVTLLAATSITTAMTTAGIVTISDQMPEQKISDFIGSLVRAFNLVIVPTGNGQYDIEPLDDWYAEGTTREITEYVDTEEVNINKPQLYRRINFSYNETEAILGEQYRLQNDIGYGDLRADFTFDGEEFNVEVGFDNMLFERLDDLDNGLSEINVGKTITRELEPYIGNPYIFYASGTITVSSDDERYGYIDMGNGENAKSSFWFASNVNATTAANVTKTLNFGTEVDPYLLQGFSQGLYNTYWKDYITDLYDTQRRVFMYKAQLPLGIMLALKVNDKLTIGERNYIINQLKLNLTTGEAQMELLNDV